MSRYMLFTGAVAYLAEEANHHPDITIQWNRVTLTLSTHSAGGLIANFAGRRLRVPTGRHVRIELLDPALGANVSPPVYAREVDSRLWLIPSLAASFC